MFFPVHALITRYAFSFKFGISLKSAVIVRVLFSELNMATITPLDDCPDQNSAGLVELYVQSGFTPWNNMSACAVCCGDITNPFVWNSWLPIDRILVERNQMLVLQDVNVGLAKLGDVSSNEKR